MFEARLGSIEVDLGLIGFCEFLGCSCMLFEYVLRQSQTLFESVPICSQNHLSHWLALGDRVVVSLLSHDVLCSLFFLFGVVLGDCGWGGGVQDRKLQSVLCENSCNLSCFMIILNI